MRPVETAIAPRNPFVARVERLSRAHEGGRTELAIDTSRLHFFDLESGLGIYDSVREPALATA